MIKDKFKGLLQLLTTGRLIRMVIKLAKGVSKKHIYSLTLNSINSFFFNIACNLRDNAIG